MTFVSDRMPVRTAAASRLADETRARFVDWREACAVVRERDERCALASPAERTDCFVAYNAALDREERAARQYAAAIEELRQFLWPGLGPARDPLGLR